MTAAVKAAILKRYPADAFALAWEVGNSTGFACNRHADAIAMSLWPSRGLDLVGFEFKASRSDWLKELRQPAKADSFIRYCDHWWLVVTDAAIVKDGELPTTWGLLALKKSALRVVKAAPKLAPIAMDRAFMAALLRGCSKPAVASDKAALLEARNKGYAEAKERYEDEAKRRLEARDQLRAKIAKFESDAGFRFEAGWRHPANVGQIVRDVLNGVHDRDRDEMRRIHDAASRVLEATAPFLETEAA